ncbi:MAG: DUF1810 domain-containing protein [Endomicrobium sp.]|jgi:uncharacterized protein (DUF1810 family)|nr:DUF1810 domain-containing protein [Endomicrobium sp.]
MDKIKICLLYLGLVITFVSCKNNSSTGDIVARNDKNVMIDATDLSKVVGDLQRFRLAQTQSQLSAVESELSNGKKTNHWIWYIFPQLDGLVANPSSTNKYYSIKTRKEAIAYLNDVFLSSNLKKHVALVRGHSKTKTLNQIFDGDNIKFRSSMTLFGQIIREESCFSGQENIFFGVLTDFNENKDIKTLDLMQQDFFNR